MKRCHMTKEWKDSHTITEPKIGMELDVRDTEYIWCRGSIEKIVTTFKSKSKLLYVHYDGWNRYYDEFIWDHSPRLAPLGLYTK